MTVRNQKGGRPKLPPSQKKAYAIAALLTESERELVDEFVSKQNVDISTFLRGLIFERIQKEGTVSA